MSNQAVCPYYGCDEEICDVGCGYISPHDAKMIIKFCSAQFCECHKYRELSDRLGERLPAAASTATPWAAPVHAGASPVAVPAFGLFCFGVTAALFALKQLPVPLEIHQLSLVIMAGALGQIITGLGALRTNQLRAVAFTAFGLFWLSLLAVELLPSAGYGQSPGPLPQAGYFTMWGMFSLILAQGGDRLARSCRVVFSLATVFLLMLALACFTGNVMLKHSAALVGFTCSLPGLFCGVRQAWRETLRLLMPGRSQVQAQRVR
jgi:succinate-acetate transporter protein